ncbi:poly(3-hydroxybutyrate) depolymerase [Candidatus Woesearchaeota archaeon]|nr:poly(3-hydroxybutyrate) depolymerase [Candidatus Woesearchaeota archaeon]
MILFGCQISKDRHIINQNPSPDDHKADLFEPGDYRYEINYNNVNRYYLLHVPTTYDHEKLTLVLAFHGGMGDATIMSKYYGWKEKSDEEGFIVAFPNGASRLRTGKLATWNAGSCCGYAAESNSDDVGFVKKIIEDIKSRIEVDKIFATGMSNGGMFSHRLACEMPDTFTAIGAVAGTNNFEDCDPKDKISIMLIHSLNDQHVLYNGGCGPDCRIVGETEFVSVPDTILGWIKINNCSKTPNITSNDQNSYCETYTECTDGVKVKACTTKDGGHSWPGVDEFPNLLEKTEPSKAIIATDEIWAFFESN